MSCKNFAEELNVQKDRNKSHVICKERVGEEVVTSRKNGIEVLASKTQVILGPTEKEHLLTPPDVP